MKCYDKQRDPAQGMVCKQYHLLGFTGNRNVYIVHLSIAMVMILRNTAPFKRLEVGGTCMAVDKDTQSSKREEEDKDCTEPLTELSVLEGARVDWRINNNAEARSIRSPILR